MDSDVSAPVFTYRSDSAAKPLRFYDRAERRVRAATALVTSRSCPFNCSFCAIILIGRKWRRASPAKVVADLAALETSAHERYEHVYFMDANFFVSAQRAVEIAEALQRFRPGMTFSFSTRVNQLLRGSQLLPELRRLGLRAVELGIESGSDAALQRFGKDTRAEQNAEAVARLRELGIHLILDFIMFDAEASLSDLTANLAFIEDNALDSYVPWDHLFSYMTPYLGTQIRSRYEELLNKHFDEDEYPHRVSCFSTLMCGRCLLSSDAPWS